MNARPASLPRVGLVSALVILQVVMGVPLVGTGVNEAQAQIPEPRVWIAPLETEGGAGLKLLSQKLDEALRNQLGRSSKLELTEQVKGQTISAGEADPRVEQAETLRVAGRDAFLAKRFEEAQEKLGAALALYSEGVASVNRFEAVAETLGFLGATAVELKFDADAKDYFNRVVALVPDAEPLDEYPERTKALFAKTKKKLLKKKRGALEINSVPPGAMIRVDGVAQGKAPVTVKDLVRGQHYVQASDEAAGIAGLGIRVKGGRTRAITLTLEKTVGPKAAQAADPGLVANLRALAAGGQITGAFRDQAEAIASQTRADYLVVSHIAAQGNNFVLRGFIYGVEQKQTAAFDELKFRADLASVFVQASNYAAAIEKAVEKFPFDKVVVGQLVMAPVVPAPVPAPVPTPAPAPAPAPLPKPDPVVAVAPAPRPVEPGLDTRPPPPMTDDPDDDDGAWYGQWWVWTIVGVAVAGGAVAGGYLLSQDEPGGGNSFDAEVRW